jgi:hypothetical protein
MAVQPQIFFVSSKSFTASEAKVFVVVFVNVFHK